MTGPPMDFVAARAARAGERDFLPTRAAAVSRFARNCHLRHPMPLGVSPDCWRQAVLDAVGLPDKRGPAAAKRGWTTPDPFGVHPTRPDRRVDCAGLAWRLDRGIVRVLTEDQAVILRPCDSRQTYRRANRPEIAVPTWDLPPRSGRGA